MRAKSTSLTIVADTLAVPRDFGSRRGEGTRRAISFGGGGLYFVAWQLAYLRGLGEAGVILDGADQLIGTSAGALVATAFAAGRAKAMHDQMVLLSRFPAVLAALAPSGQLAPSQTRALDLFGNAVTADPATVQRIGHAALGAATPSTAAMRRNVALTVRVRRWPSASLSITCVDAYTGERCVITSDARVSPAAAMAASSAIPGIFPPQPILDRFCMDGGVSGSGLHLDLVAGAERVLVFSLNQVPENEKDGMTKHAGDTSSEIAALRATGTEVIVRSPAPVPLEDLMSPGAVTDAVAKGQASGIADADEIREFWGTAERVESPRSGRIRSGRGTR